MNAKIFFILLSLSSLTFTAQEIEDKNSYNATEVDAYPVVTVVATQVCCEPLPIAQTIQSSHPSSFSFTQAEQQQIEMQRLQQIQRDLKVESTRESLTNISNHNHIVGNIEIERTNSEPTFTFHLPSNEIYTCFNAQTNKKLGHLYRQADTFKSEKDIRRIMQTNDIKNNCACLVGYITNIICCPLCCGTGLPNSCRFPGDRKYYSEVPPCYQTKFPNASGQSNLRIAEEQGPEYEIESVDGCVGGSTRDTYYHVYNKSTNEYLGKLHSSYDAKKSDKEILRILKNNKTSTCCCITFDTTLQNPNL